ncbi:MAG: amidohydrolase [Desulfobacterales bacterium]|nr:amidohydrolase [Desulfobacterales bacterium]
MENFDILLKNGIVLTMDKNATIIKNGCVGIKSDQIVYIGDIDENLKGKKEININGGIILPGLINGHTHASMSLFRGMADDLHLMDWLNNYIFPAEQRMDANFVYNGALLACVEMIMSGTTTFCDMYLFEDEVAKAANKANIRCLVGEVLFDFPSPNYGQIEKGFEYTKELIKKWKGHPTVSIAVEPHALYTCSPDLLKKANEIALENNVPLILHLSETKTEVNEIKNKYNKLPIDHLENLGLLGGHLIADHCVHLNNDEMDKLAKYDVKVIYNPESNMKLASGMAPIKELKSKGITVGIGTDGCASNNNLDLFSEMDIAAKLPKVQYLDPTIMDAFTVLKMATIDGAKALGIDKITGSIEFGKKADIIVIDTNKPHLIPMYNPYSHIVYSACGSDVIHSIINGKLVMEDRNLLYLDLQEIMNKGIEEAQRVKSWLM